MNESIPTHPGAVLRETVLPNLLGITKIEFAKMLGISRQTLYVLLAERTDASAIQWSAELLAMVQAQ